MKRKKQPSIFRQELKRDWNTFKSLHGKKKLQFYWDYFKWHTVAFLFIIVTVCTFANMLWEGARPCRLRVCVVLNTDDNCSSWFREFTRELQSDGRKGDVDVNLDQPFDYDNMYYYVQEIEIMTTVSSARMDIAICGPDLYSYLLALNACLPLDASLSPDLRAALTESGRLVYDTANLTIDKSGNVNPTDGIDGYYAIDLSDTIFDSKYNQPEEKDDAEPLYAVIIANTEHLDDCEALIRALIRS